MWKRKGKDLSLDGWAPWQQASPEWMWLWGTRYPLGWVELWKGMLHSSRRKPRLSKGSGKATVSCASVCRSLCPNPLRRHGQSPRLHGDRNIYGWIRLPHRETEGLVLLGLKAMWLWMCSHIVLRRWWFIQLLCPKERTGEGLMAPSSPFRSDGGTLKSHQTLTDSHPLPLQEWGNHLLKEFIFILWLSTNKGNGAISKYPHLHHSCSEVLIAKCLLLGGAEGARLTFLYFICLFYP